MKINMTISEKDPMYTGDIDIYKRIGISGLKCVQDAVSMIHKKDSDIKNILDFACGYGRVLRSLQAGYPDASITACDLMKDAIVFCANTFGAIPVKGNENLSLINLPKKYDVIWIGSLFTHLPIERWGVFLDFFSNNITQDGILVFTIHGRKALWMMKQYNLLPKEITANMFEIFKDNFFNSGYAFYDYTKQHKDALSKIDANHSKAFGLSFTRPDYEYKYLLKHNKFNLVSYAEGAWAHNHDVVSLRLNSREFLEISNKKQFVKIEEGSCPCCDSDTTFISEKSWLRDNYRCVKCNCIPRERGLSYVIEQILPNWKNLVIHESSPGNRGTSLKLQKNCKNYISSHYYPNSKEEYVDGYKNIDLHKQNFEDEVFDLVVTQDVFEHLPYPEKAIKEIARTLKKGGYFISTIPLVKKFNPTVKWAELVDGDVKFFYEPDYHGNPIDPKGSPVFWHYGYDIASRFIEWSGMETIIVNNIIPELGIEAEFLEIVVCRKL